MKKRSIFCAASLILLCVIRVSRAAVIRDYITSHHNVFRSDGIIMNQVKSSNIMLNISHQGIKNLSAANLSDPNLTILMASHNRLTNISDALFVNTPAIAEINFAYNKISTIHSNAFQNATKIAVLSFAHNKILLIDSGTFSQLADLHTLDLSNNRIQMIDPDLFKINTNLRELRLENNPIQRFDKQFFWPILNSPSFLLYVSCENAHEMDTSSFGRTLQWQIDRDSGVSLKSSKSMSKMECMTGEKFTNLRHFNCSGNGLKNTANVIGLLGNPIETLDVSSNYVGKINAQTFERFANLKYLNLSRTQLDNFGFNTFYHQRRLLTLDISYNHLKNVNFTLFFRIFRQLNTLNLEGNDFHEVNSVTKGIFPKLSLLGISKNSFSCEYLTKFLRQWEQLNLMDNPSPNRMHIDGIDCFDDDNNDVRIETLLIEQTPKKSVEQHSTQVMTNQIGPNTKSTQMYTNQYRMQSFQPTTINYPVVWTYQSNTQARQYGQRNAIVNSYPMYYYTYTNRFM